MLHGEYRCLLEIVYSFPFDKYPEVGLLNHEIVIFLPFWGISILFSIMAATIYMKDSFFRKITFFIELFSYILNTSSHPLLAYKVTAQKPLIILWGATLYVTSQFSLAAFRIFFGFDFWISNYNVCQCRSLPVQTICGLLSLMDLSVHFSLQVWEIFIHYLFK